LKYGKGENVLKDFDLQYYLVSGDWQTLSINNVTEEIREGINGTEITYYAYQFLSNGFPGNLRISDNKTSGFLSIDDYYE
jgi:hypothetical protein